MSLKLSDRTPVRETEINNEAKNTDIELIVLFDTDNFGDEINSDELDQLNKLLGYYVDYKRK